MKKLIEFGVVRIGCGRLILIDQIMEFNNEPQVKIERMNCSKFCKFCQHMILKKKKKVRGLLAAILMATNFDIKCLMKK